MEIMCTRQFIWITTTTQIALVFVLLYSLGESLYIFVFLLGELDMKQAAESLNFKEYIDEV
jgi:hypothetical protein